MNYKIRVSNLKKSYGKKEVLKGISFDIKEGEIFALLGINGAGKTTTLECMEGLREYDYGKICINGKVGVQLQTSSLPENIRCYEVLNLFSKWNKGSIDNELIKRLGLKNILKKQYKELSTGQKRRLHLVLSIIGNPDIIFLDEPTAGLDVEGRVSFHEEIKRLKSSGKTIIIASHDMAEVESLCDKIAILKDGCIVFIGTANELTNNIKSVYKIKVKLSAKLENLQINYSEYKGINKEYYNFESNCVHEALLELLNLIKENKIDINDIKIERASLEECFMSITKGDEE